MASKVHLIDDFSAKEARIKLELANCMQKTYGNQNPWLHKNQSYALIDDFYPCVSHILLLTISHFSGLWKQVCLATVHDKIRTKFVWFERCR